MTDQKKIIELEKLEHKCSELMKRATLINSNELLEKLELLYTEICLKKLTTEDT